MLVQYRKHSTILLSLLVPLLLFSVELRGCDVGSDDAGEDAIPREREQPSGRLHQAWRSPRAATVLPG